MSPHTTQTQSRTGSRCVSLAQKISSLCWAQVEFKFIFLHSVHWHQTLHDHERSHKCLKFSMKCCSSFTLAKRWAIKQFNTSTAASCWTAWIRNDDFFARGCLCCPLFVNWQRYIYLFVGIITVIFKIVLILIDFHLHMCFWGFADVGYIFTSGVFQLIVNEVNVCQFSKKWNQHSHTKTSKILKLTLLHKVRNFCLKCILM